MTSLAGRHAGGTAEHLAGGLVEDFDRHLKSGGKPGTAGFQAGLRPGARDLKTNCVTSRTERNPGRCLPGGGAGGVHQGASTSDDAGDHGRWSHGTNRSAQAEVVSGGARGDPRPEGPTRVVPR